MKGRGRDLTRLVCQLRSGLRGNGDVDGKTRCSARGQGENLSPIMFALLRALMSGARADGRIACREGRRFLWQWRTSPCCMTCQVTSLLRGSLAPSAVDPVALCLILRSLAHSLQQRGSMPCHHLQKGDRGSGPHRVANGHWRVEVPRVPCPQSAGQDASARRR